MVKEEVLSPFLSFFIFDVESVAMTKIIPKDTFEGKVLSDLELVDYSESFFLLEMKSDLHSANNLTALSRTVSVMGFLNRFLIGIPLILPSTKLTGHFVLITDIG